MDYTTAASLLGKYSLDSFLDPESTESYVKDFELRKLLVQVEADRIANEGPEHLRTVNASDEKPLEPEFDDLARLHYIVLTRKVVNVLEFGSGFSTIIMAAASSILRKEFGDWAGSNLRVANPFFVYSVEEEQRFAEITRSRLGDLAEYANVTHSSVRLDEVNHRFCTLYDTIPNISPDFIYLDGPSQYATTETRQGFGLGDACRMPMSADLLRFEYFLEPGTLVLVDGRTANARFLKDHFKRNWVHEHDPAGDVHYFELVEEPLGKFNRAKMEFCLNR